MSVGEDSVPCQLHTQILQMISNDLEAMEFESLRVHVARCNESQLGDCDLPGMRLPKPPNTVFCPRSGASIRRIESHHVQPPTRHARGDERQVRDLVYRKSTLRNLQVGPHVRPNAVNQKNGEQCHPGVRHRCDPPG